VNGSYDEGGRKVGHFDASASQQRAASSLTPIFSPYLAHITYQAASSNAAWAFAVSPTANPEGGILSTELGGRYRFGGCARGDGRPLAFHPT